MTDEPWSHLRERTPARIALGRAGAALPTRELLAFAADHAAARDAVRAELDLDKLAAEITALGLTPLPLRSAAESREVYLRQPDLGRRLAEGQPVMRSACDVSLVLADGLSALGVQRHGPALLDHLVRVLKPLTVGPVAVVSQGRVAIQDEIGEKLGAQASVILIGERPGLSVADSVGAYLVYGPRVGRRDSERNCISNIRPGGLELPAAAATIAHLVNAALTRRLSGVELKDERPVELPGNTATKENPRLAGGSS